jgi:N-glycosylase/DNA lyase
MYNDIQGFLVEAWGPLGGWCQAVVFAAEIERRKRAGATKVVKAVIAKTEDVDSVVLAKIEHVETATLDIKRKPEIEQTTRAGRYSKRTRK